MHKITIESLNTLNLGALELINVLGLKNKSNISNCIAFYGQMGAGKTTLIKAICQELGVVDTASSPSFSLVNEYVTENGECIFHFDFYRINHISEAFDFGYEEYFYSSNLCLIEWPEKIESLLPLPFYKLNILQGENEKRIIEISQIH